MRIALIFALVITLYSCSQPEKPITAAEPVFANVPDDTVKITHIDADTTKLLLMGRGSEPGWFCEFYQTKVRFVYDHGKDSLIVRGLDLSNQMSNPKGFELFKLESLTKDTIFETLEGPCTEESTGEARSMKMQIVLGKRTYKGCAWTLK